LVATWVEKLQAQRQVVSHGYPERLQVTDS
jgi:hypothetical protein